jgi:hypothetical protein
MYSLAGTLDEVAPYLPPELVAPAPLAAARAVAAHLPAALTHWVYLECRLRAAAPGVDLIVNVDERGRDILAGDNSAIALGAHVAGHPAWQAVRAFAREWSRAGSVLHDAVEDVWLEFDVGAPVVASPDETSTAVPVPGVFIDFAEAAYTSPSLAARLEVAVAWTLHFPAGTDVPSTYRVKLGGRSLEVVAQLGPRTNELLRRVLCREAT